MALPADKALPPLEPGQVGMMAAVSRNFAIGQNGGLPWDIPEDTAFFHRMTRPGVQVCGRLVWGEVKAHGLDQDPEREWIVVSRSLKFNGPHQFCRNSVAAALHTARARAAARDWPIWILGGERIYADCLTTADRLYLTLIDLEVPTADTFFPRWQSVFDKKITEQVGQLDHPTYRFTVWEKTRHKGPAS